MLNAEINSSHFKLELYPHQAGCNNYTMPNIICSFLTDADVIEVVTNMYNIIAHVVYRRDLALPASSSK